MEKEINRKNDKTGDDPLLLLDNSSSGNSPPANVDDELSLQDGEFSDFAPHDSCDDDAEVQVGDDNEENNHESEEIQEGDDDEEKKNHKSDGDDDNSWIGHNGDNDSRNNDYQPRSESDESKDEEELKILPGSRAVTSLLCAIGDDFFDECKSPINSPMKARSPRRVGRPVSTKFTKRRPPKGASRSEIEEYEKERKDFYDKTRRDKLNSPNTRPINEYSGVHHPMLQTMLEVEQSRLQKGHTFTSRDILLLRVKEEANLRGIGINVVKSDIFCFICCSHKDPTFVVPAYQSMKKGYGTHHTGCSGHW